MKAGVVLWPVAELEEFFRTAKLPEPPIELFPGGPRIIHVETFVKSHLQAIKKHNGKKVYLPYYERLVKFKEIIENGK
jgi:hypothetical protein